MYKLTYTDEIREFFNILSDLVNKQMPDKYFIHFGKLNCELYEFDFSGERNVLYDKVFSLINDLFGLKVGLFHFLDKFLPLIEVICEDYNDNIVIKKEQLYEHRTLDLKNHIGAFSLIMNKLAEKESLNIYYHFDKIYRFEFKEVMIDDTFNPLRAYFQNLRALFCKIAIRFYETIYFTISSCADSLFTGSYDIYKGKLISLKLHEINWYILHTDLKSIVNDIYNQPNECIKAGLICNLNTDIEVMNWIEFCNHIIFYLMKLKILVSDQIENICIALFTSFRKNLMKSFVLTKVPEDKLQELVKESLRVTYTQLNFTTDVTKQTSLYFFICLFNNYLVRESIIKLVQSCVLDKLKLLANNVVSLQRMANYKNLKNYIKEKEKKEIKEWCEKDLRKLQKINEFLDLINWYGENIGIVTLIYETSLEKTRDIKNSNI
jgi:hypothetical protein